MDANRSVRLFTSLWPQIDAALLEENRCDRLRFISDVLQCFANNGTDLSKLLSLDEDVRACAKLLGAMPATPKPRTGRIKLDLSGVDDPVDYVFVNGPFDGTSIRLSTGLSEMPPGMVTFAADEQPTRFNSHAAYKLQHVTECGEDGIPNSEYLAYEYVPEVVQGSP